MPKVSAPKLRAGLLNNANTFDTLNQYFENGQAYAFMNSIKGIPGYSKKFNSEVLGTVKQLGVPTFFLTLSSADLRWNELVEIIQKLNKEDCNISNLSHHDRCSILNSSTVIVARHVQYRVEFFFKVFIIDEKSKYYAIRVEVQICQNPHIHSFIWVVHASKVSWEIINEYRAWLDGLIKADLPNP